MILDTSALIAILQDEPESGEFLDAIENADAVKISTVSALETSLVMKGRYGSEGVKRLHTLLALIEAEEIPFSTSQRECAEKAFSLYGKGQGHRAQLNFGDCCAYALAKTLVEPLLFKGKDFIHTDIENAV